MKKFTLLFIVSFCILSIANAQITKGSTFLGGSINVSTSSTKEELPPAVESIFNQWSIRPQFGKTIANNKIIGVYLNFGGSKEEYPYYSSQPDMRKIESSSYGGGFFYRQYFPMSSRFYLFGEGNVGVSFSKSEGHYNNVLTNDRKSVGAGLAIAPGLSFAATRKLHLELAMNQLFAVNYSSGELKDFNTSGTQYRSAKETSFSASANANPFSQLSIGLRWILPSE